MKKKDRVVYNKFLTTIINGGYKIHDDSLPEPLKDMTYSKTKDNIMAHKVVGGNMISFGVDMEYLWQKEMMYFICKDDEELHYMSMHPFLADLKEFGVVIDF